MGVELSEKFQTVLASMGTPKPPWIWDWGHGLPAKPGYRRLLAQGSALGKRHVTILATASRLAEVEQGSQGNIVGKV